MENNKYTPVTTSANYPQGHTGLGLVGASLNSPVAVSTTEQEIIALNENASELLKLTRILSDRLTGVLRQPFPRTDQDGGQREGLPPLANAVYQGRQVVCKAIYNLNDILERLDI